MQNTVPTGPSRTPRPAHPAELASDRLIDVVDQYFKAGGQLTVEERDAFHMVRRALWRIAERDES